jgi:hypothetical protein
MVQIILFVVTTYNYKTIRGLKHKYTALIKSEYIKDKSLRAKFKFRGVF